MITQTYEGVVTALSSIIHSGGQSLGITTKLRREKFVIPGENGAPAYVEEIPVVSGNGLRGLLRDRGMLQMCRALGYGEPEEQELLDRETGEVGHRSVPRGLSLAAFHFLFSGGSLTSETGGSKALNIEAARKLAELIPLVGVFGGALGNLIMPGKISIGKLIPMCAETRHVLPERFRNHATLSVWDLCQEEMYTRKDDAKNERLRPLMLPQGPERPALPGVVAAAKGRGPRETEKTGEKQQMMYYVETFCAGTPFFWRLTLEDVTDVERDAVLVTLAEFSRRPYIGGRSAVGHGEVSVVFDQWMTIDSRLRPEGRLSTMTVGTAYAQHLATRGVEIRATLDGMK